MTDEAVPAKDRKTANSAGKKTKAPPPEKPLYPGVLSRLERLEFDSLGRIEGIDDEITLLRVKIRRLLRREPNNTRLIAETVKILASLVKLRYTMTDKKSKNLKEAINGVFKELAAPLGVNLATELGKRIIK